MRVRFTNTFGRKPLEIGRAAIGVHGTLAGVAGANVPLSFGGSPSVLIPAGAEALSDPVQLTIKPLQDLAVSVFLPAATGPATQHALAQQVNYAAAGNHTLDTGASAFTKESKSRLDRDVLDRAGVRDVILLEGVNDIGFSH